MSSVFTHSQCSSLSSVAVDTARRMSFSQQREQQDEEEEGELMQEYEGENNESECTNTYTQLQCSVYAHSHSHTLPAASQVHFSFSLKSNTICARCLNFILISLYSRCGDGTGTSSV